jgi:ankyrin repeat protein
MTRRSSGLASLVLAAAALCVLPAALNFCSARVGVRREAVRHIARAGEAGADAGITSLMTAANSGDAAEIRKLAEGGAEPNELDAYGWSALRYAVRSGHMDAATALIELGADVDLASKSGRTPLMSAAGNGLSDMVEMLLKAGADHQATNSAGETAFRISMRGGVLGCAECRKLLTIAD